MGALPSGPVRPRTEVPSTGIYRCLDKSSVSQFLSLEIHTGTHTEACGDVSMILHRWLYNMRSAAPCARPVSIMEREASLSTSWTTSTPVAATIGSIMEYASFAANSSAAVESSSTLRTINGIKSCDR